MAKFILSAFADEAAKTLDGQISALHRNDIPYLEPRDICGPILDKSRSELQEIRSTLDLNGIRVYSLGSPIGKYDADKPFDCHWEKYLKALDTCHILGAQRMRIFSFFTKQEDLKKNRPVVLERLCAMTERAAQEGIILCHENETDIYGQNPPEVRDLLDNVPGLRGIFDASNFLMNDQDPMEGFEATAEKLEYIHMKDCISSLRATIPVGMGEGRYDEILQKVDAMTDATVTLTLEPHLFGFEAYNLIDKHDLKVAMQYASADEAFDAAAAAVKNTLRKIGFRQEGNTWTK